MTSLGTDQIHQLVTDSTHKDTLFYEYEIIDKKKELRWAHRQARKHGLCVCSRWLFTFCGNFWLVVLIASACAILIYVNTPIDLTTQPLTWQQNCASNGFDSQSCDYANRRLICSNGVCICESNRVWNGTDCICNTNFYWDGAACVRNQGYWEPCSQAVPCFSPNFVCDPASGLCQCTAITSLVPYYTMYYQQPLTNVYGTCANKVTNNIACTVNYYAGMCREYLGLTCSATTGRCACYNGWYWNGTGCALQVSYGQSCALNTAAACLTNQSLICTANLCACTCQTLGGYQANCLTTSWCNSTIALLQCNIPPFTSGNCPNVSVSFTCDCASGYYWDGQMCVTQVALGGYCPYSCSCTSSTCLYGLCV